MPEKDYELGSVTAVVQENPRIGGKSSYVSLPVDDLFRGDIVHSYAGLPGNFEVGFKTQYCDSISEGLANLLTKAGNWDVQISPDVYKSFNVRLKSHSGREFFYKDGYWWKAFVQIKFTEDNGNGKCSRANIYLYDSVVCGGPIDDDPDKSGRTQCFQRIEPDSKAEVDLRDHLSQILQKSYGAPKAR